MRKNEKEGVMQRENERIIYHLMHFNEKDKEWSERPYLLLEDMAIVFDILDLDDQSIQRIDHKKANKEQWSDQFLWESAKKNTKQLLPAKFEPVYKDFRGHTEDRPVFMVSNKIQRYGAAVICYEDFLDDISSEKIKKVHVETLENDDLKSRIHKEDYTFEIPRNRTQFFDDSGRMSYDDLIRKYLPASRKDKMATALKPIIHKMLFSHFFFRTMKKVRMNRRKRK